MAKHLKLFVVNTAVINTRRHSHVFSRCLEKCSILENQMQIKVFRTYVIYINARGIHNE